MNRQQFMEQLKKKLEKLPYDEIKEAVDYYEQYFEDAGEDQEEAVIAELGSPSNIASQIIAEFAIKDIEADKSAKSTFSNIWLIILAVFASPLALPLAIAVVSVIIALVVAIAAVFFSIGVTGVALAGSGFLVMIAGFFMITQSLATTIFYLGIGMILIGLGVGFTAATISLAGWCFTGLAKSIGKRMIRRKE